MVYIHSWQEFQDAAEDLYQRSPNNSRYCVKWKSSEGKLVLKITDNSSCIKFKTNSSIFLNRFEALNLSLIRKMQNQQLKEEQPTIELADVHVVNPDNDQSTRPPAQSSSAVPTQLPTNAGVKKKKPKKKKG